MPKHMFVRTCLQSCMVARKRVAASTMCCLCRALQALNALLQRGGVAHTELLGCKDAAAQLLSLAAGSTAVSLSTDSAGESSPCLVHSIPRMLR